MRTRARAASDAGRRVSIASVDLAIDPLAVAIADSSWAEAVHFHGIDLFDAARSPLFVDLLATVRRAEPAATSTWRDRLRRYVFDRQLPRPVVEWRARRRSNHPPRDGILVWPRDSTHADVVEPVVDTLLRAADPPRVGYVVCQPSMFDRLPSAATPRTLTRAEWPSLVRHAEIAAAPVLDRLREPITLDPALTAMLGIGPGRVERTLRDTLTRQIPTLLETILATEQIADELGPRALVVGNDLTIEGRAAVLTARASGIPTASLMHGTVSGDPLQRHHRVDRFLVHGERSRRTLESLGLDADRIVVTGNPRFAERPPYSSITDRRIAEIAGIASGQPWFLVASSGPGHRVSLSHHRRFVAAVTQAARALPETRFVVKLHRKDQLEHYPAAPPFALVPHGTAGAPNDIFRWLCGPAAVITGASTVALEALLMRVPVLTLDLDDELSRVDVIEARATEHSRTAAGLERRARAVLQRGGAAPGVTERAEAFLRETYSHLDGGAAAAAADAILTLAGTGEKAATP